MKNKIQHNLSCPVCGKYKFQHNISDICPYCGWEDDDDYTGGGANHFSLEKFRARYYHYLSIMPKYMWKNQGFIEEEE
ncbi:MAG: hypothetical protein J6Z08_06690 [Elusimicrobiales bacterium]|nr:hypothetical protein [Elusimicrobiales bacterium]